MGFTNEEGVRNSMMLHAPSSGMTFPIILTFSPIPLKTAVVFNASITLSPRLITGVFWLQDPSSSIKTITPYCEETEENASASKRSSNPVVPSTQYADEYSKTFFCSPLESSTSTALKSISGEPARGVTMITILSINPEVLCPWIVDTLNPVETSLIVCVPVELD